MTSNFQLKQTASVISNQLPVLNNIDGVKLSVSCFGWQWASTSPASTGTRLELQTVPEKLISNSDFFWSSTHPSYIPCVWGVGGCMHVYLRACMCLCMHVGGWVWCSINTNYNAVFIFEVLCIHFCSCKALVREIPHSWAIQAGLLTPLTFARHRLSPLATFTSGACFLHSGRRWRWICEFYTANFKGIFGGP